MILRLANLAKRRSIALRQSYVRVAPQLLKRQSRYAHARQFKRAAGCTRKLKHRLGRLVRDIRRKATPLDDDLKLYIERAERLLAQTRESQNKLYSIDAPEVECISKGKAHKRYEFGCKVSVATTNKFDWILGIQALHGNPYDGHTLSSAVAQVERITHRAVTAIFLDKGYRGHNYTGDAEVHITGRRSRRPATLTLRRRKKRRAAIEPKIGHLKSDNRMDRNYLKGEEGDRINALMAGIGANMRKLLAAFWRALWLLVRYSGLHHNLAQI
jgi:IS5 family transposase